MYFRTYTYLTDTGVPLGTIGLIFTRISPRSYRVSSYAELIFITDVCSFGTPVGVTEFILFRTYTYNRLLIIRDSRRSYIIY